MTSKDENDKGENQSVGNDGTEKVAEGSNAGGEVKDKLGEPSNEEKAIIRQVEFYFGDANLPRDKFMQEQIKLDDGWIPMSTMLKFQRLAKLSSDPQVIAKALLHSDLVDVDQSSSEPKLRRSPQSPLPELNAERRKAIMERTVYCKGFPLDANIDVVMDALNPHGPPENIFMRRYKDKLTQKYVFKGSVFATFPTIEKAKTFMELESVKTGDVELVKMWQNDYFEKKKNEHSAANIFKNKTRNDVKKDKEKENADLKAFKKGATLYLSGDFLTLTREDLKEAVGKYDIHPAYFGFNKGDKEAYLRLPEENSAKPAAEKIGSELTVGDAKLAVRVLEGEEEEAYLKQAEKDKKQHMQRCQRAKRGGMRQGNRKRRPRNRDDDGEAEPKKAKQ